MSAEPQNISRPKESDSAGETLESVRKALAGLSYGSIEITVHDGRVVQIERKERIRFGTGNGKT